jgi:hypothetical protein
MSGGEYRTLMSGAEYRTLLVKLNNELADKDIEIAKLRDENKQLVNDHHRLYGAALIKVDKLCSSLEKIKRVTDFASFHGHLMEGSDAAHRAHEISCDTLASLGIR